MAMPHVAPALAMEPTAVSFAGPRAGNELVLSAALFRPDAAAPRPAVVVVHGCGGVGQGVRDWGRRLAESGYVGLVIDSFGGRGVKEVCTRGGATVDARDRAWDIAGAVAWLKAQPFVRPDRIAVQGHSHGGAATLFATLGQAGDRSPPPEPGFVAAVAFYPDCSLRGRTEARFEVRRPLVVLVGEKDDWTPADRCRELLPRLSGQPVALHTYADAYHGFDTVGSKPRYRPEVGNRNKPGGCCGAWIGYNEAAFRDASERLRSFWERHLGAP